MLELITPPLSDDEILPGITGTSVLEVSVYRYRHQEFGAESHPWFLVLQMENSNRKNARCSKRGRSLPIFFQTSYGWDHANGRLKNASLTSQIAAEGHVESIDACTRKVNYVHLYALLTFERGIIQKFPCPKQYTHEIPSAHTSTSFCETFRWPS